MPVYYCCIKEDNICEIKDTCERYLADDIGTTLFKQACTNENKHVLYIDKKELPKETVKRGSGLDCYGSIYEKEEKENGEKGNGEPSESLPDGERAGSN